MIPIAHRGLWWPEHGHQLTMAAAEKAADLGYGVELDVCLDGEDVLVRHHPRELRKPSFPSYHPQAYFEKCLEHDPWYFWDIKTDGLVQPRVAELDRYGVTHRSVIFDQDFFQPESGFFNRDPDAGERFKEEGPELTVCVRASIRSELDSALKKDWADAIWMDGLEGDWMSGEDIQRVRDAGKKAFVVSPEVHGRPLKVAIWKGWQSADGILTDLPHFMSALLSDTEGCDRLYPKEPWW